MTPAGRRPADQPGGDDRWPLRAYESAGAFEADLFAEAVLDLVEQIPAGRVMSYGSIAASLGSRASRQVGKVMKHGGADVPWWRVVHADGRPADGHDAEAREHFEAEGTPLRVTANGYRVAMRQAGWQPDSH